MYTFRMALGIAAARKINLGRVWGRNGPQLGRDGVGNDDTTYKALTAEVGS